MKISFVMATRNSEPFLAAALASITPALGDDRTTYEVVVADGGSQDRTVAIAEAHPHVRIVSRSDRGIYDGMNKALDAARGEALLILNSDDVLPSGALGRALALLARHPDHAFVSGAALFGARIEDATRRDHAGALSEDGAIFGIPAINARLFRSAAVRAAGPIPTDIGLAADRAWLLRFIDRSERGLALDEPLYFYRQHGGSHTLDRTLAGRRRVYAAERHFAGKLMVDPSSSASRRRLGAASLAVATVKLAVTAAGTASSEAAGDAPQPASMWGLVEGVALAARWRGRLAGW